jgi:uncharacterized membrane protein
MSDVEHTMSNIRARTPHRRGFDMEGLVGYILLIGVLSSVVLILAGLAWHWAATGQLSFQYSLSGTNLFRFALANLRQLDARAIGPGLLVNLGIVALLLTPYVRVLASMVYFALVEHNWKYTFFTGMVLSVLTYSLFLH